MLHPPERFDPLRDSGVVGRHDKSGRVPPHMVENHGKRGLTRATGRAGRSARRPAAKSGQWTSARAIPTRCACPPDNSFRQPIRERGEIEGKQAHRGLRRRLRLGRPGGAAAPRSRRRSASGSGPRIDGSCQRRADAAPDGNRCPARKSFRSWLRRAPRSD